MPEERTENSSAWHRRQLAPALLALALVAAVGLGGNVRTLMWVNGLHPTPEDVAFHNFQQDILGNPQHHQVPAGALATLRSALPGIYSGAGFLPSGEPSSESALLSLAPLVLFLLLWAPAPRSRRGGPLITLFPPEPPPKLLS
jgi:hypothetical protein